MSKQCTEFVCNGSMSEDDWVPCRCPKCNGFLPRDFSLGKQFQCRRCGAVLETLPSLVGKMGLDPETEGDPDMEWGGRICFVPGYAVKIETEKFPRPPRDRKHFTDRWARGDGFSRRVWRDKKGEFINVAGERLELTDPRILEVHSRF